MKDDDQLRNGTNVRLDPQTRARLERLARQFRVKKAHLIRNAIYSHLPIWERDGVKLASSNTGAAA